MNCQQVDELLAAYALDAVDDDERAAIEAHLATCDRHEEADELLAASAVLGTLAEEREPSAALESRILASAEAAPQRVVPFKQGEQPRRGRPLLEMPAAIAAAVLVAAAGFGVGAFLVGGGGDGGDQIVQSVSAGESWMRAEAREGDATVKVTLAGLRRLPETEGYQVWAIRDGRWMSVGICNTDEAGWWEGDFDFALQPQDALAVTVEPATGSERPTGEAVLRAAGGGAASEEWP